MGCRLHGILMIRTNSRFLERFWFNNYDMGDPFHWLQSWPGTPLWFGLGVQIVSLGGF
jgi:hypothetical protein